MTLLRPQFFLIIGILLLSLTSSALAQERWYQIEVSIFTNESSIDRSEEAWQAERIELTYPQNLRRLDLLSDLLHTENLTLANVNLAIPEQLNRQELSAEEIQAEIRAESIFAVGPSPASDGAGFKLFDFAREDFTQLPTSESDFQQTNRILTRSAEHRLLFHGLWRQAVVQTAQSQPVYIEGGLTYGEQNELQGSLTIHFNENEDRVVIDTNLWLTEFSIIENTRNLWTLPQRPLAMQNSQNSINTDLRYNPIQIYKMDQSREMRSNEFHYLDHPALGIVIQVEPYELPAPHQSVVNF
ncbi:MAG: hypothetical protein CMQ08_09280 [Gammaproteobacteria bacterium]|nr:hypothetical protein [Gammaproteobacteria bacterium]